MRRIIVSLVVLIVLLVAGFIAFTLLVDHFTRTAIEDRSTEALGVQARLDRASVGVARGHFALTGYNLSNPEGYQSPRLMRINDGDGSLRLGTLFANVIELPHVTLRNIEMHLERREARGNYDVVLETLRQTEQAPEEGRRYIIRELLLADIVVHVDVAPEVGEMGRLTVRIPELRLTDVGTETDGGVVMQEIAGTVLKALLAAAIERGGDELPALVQRELGARLGDMDPIAASAMEIAGQLMHDPGAALRDLDPRRFLPRRE